MATATKPRPRSSRKADRRALVKVIEQAEVNDDLLARTVFSAHENNPRLLGVVRVCSTSAEAQQFSDGYNQAASDSGSDCLGTAFTIHEDLRNVLREYMVRDAKGGAN